MGEVVSITIKKLAIASFRNYVDKYLVGLLFSSGDLTTNTNYNPDPEDEDSSDYTQYIYITTVKKAIERLDARGFSLKKIKKLFEKTKTQAINFLDFYYHSNKRHKYVDEAFVAELSPHVTFRKWENAIHKIVSYELENGNIAWHGTISEIGIRTDSEKIIFYSLKNDDSESFYGLDPKIIDIGYIIRLILEYCDIDEQIELDFSNLQYWSKDSIELAISATQNIEKTIVLVEGTSDKDILEFSLSKLYPHLSDLFYFMDFDDNKKKKRDGGTSFVIKNLKTFYFSKLNAKFIAIFDNDAEGYQSQCILLNEIKKWPDNFRILLYPEIDLFKNYPTEAPNGHILLDNINHKACSIELYLPDNIIKSNGEYLPIEWESRKKIKTKEGKEELLYQGVISQKDDIKKKFHQLRKSIERDESTLYAQDWSRMQLLLEKIIFAFKNNK